MSLLRHLIGFFLISVSTLIVAKGALPSDRCQPHQSCWPSASDWKLLAHSLKGRLVQPQGPLAVCQHALQSKACLAAQQHMHNPYYLQSQPGFTENQGWVGAWSALPSPYAIEAENAQDVQAGVDFARHHHLRLVIKGAGHDYLGRSVASDALLIWTHKMDKMHYNSHFVPESAPHGTRAVQAVTVGAGTRWIQAYTLVTTQHHRYVQGGGCATVGVAGGFLQGGGLGSWSKEYGLAAASLLQAKIVTADGKWLTANPYQNKDLFWALRGGGGGTFGVVTQVTLKTYPLPSTFGFVEATLQASSNNAYKKLIQHFLVFYRDHLNNSHWGERITFTNDNKIRIAMVYQGLSVNNVRRIWAPMTTKLSIVAIPPEKMWDIRFWQQHKADMVTANKLNDAAPGSYWWTGDGEQASAIWYAYSSWWLPSRLFDQEHIAQTAALFYRASQIHSFALHIQKGLAGGSALALASEQTTSINPALYHASALMLVASHTNRFTFNKK